MIIIDEMIKQEMAPLLLYWKICLQWKS